MSVVIVADRYESIRKTIRHLREQSLRGCLEIVIVTQSEAVLALDYTELKDFLAVQVIEVAAILPLAVATAAGIRQAKGPLVVLAESHAYPGPGWAQALIDAHQQPWAAVGAVIDNANPDSLISWANLFLDYGRCVETTAAGVVDYLPGHHTSYKRDILMQYDSQLEAVMDSEILLHWDMRAKGYQIYLTDAAKIYHVNVSSLSSWLAERFYTGRRFAATRSKPWSVPRRLLYAAGAPLIPFVRLSRVLRDLQQSTQGRVLFPRILPPLVIGLVVSAAGEAVGYLFGAGDAMERLARMELHKLRHVTERDRRALDGGSIPRHNDPGEIHGK